MFYIIASGLVSQKFKYIKSSPLGIKISTTVDVTTINRHPIDSYKWEVTKTIKRIQYSLAILKAKEYFGHEEIETRGSRRYEAKSIGKTEIF